MKSCLCNSVVKCEFFHLWSVQGLFLIQFTCEKLPFYLSYKFNVQRFSVMRSILKVKLSWSYDEKRSLKLISTRQYNVLSDVKIELYLKEKSFFINRKKQQFTTKYMSINHSDRSTTNFSLQLNKISVEMHVKGT